jgi:hypothetical protein
MEAKDTTLLEATTKQHRLHTNGAHKNNNDNTTTLMFTGLNKTTQKTWTLQEEIRAGKEKSYVLKQMYFGVNDKM